jgi:hypothetical protein
MWKLLDIFPQLLQIAPNEPEILKAVIGSVWSAVAGPHLSANVTVKGVSEKCLWLAVRDENWKRELDALTPQLIGKINRILQKRAIRRIEIIIDASVEFRRYSEDRDKLAEEYSNEPPKSLTEATRSIKDEALRNAFLRAAVESLHYKRKYGR